MSTAQQTMWVLKRARSLIGSPEKWCQGAEALDHVGHEVGWDRQSACKRCLTGAIMEAARVLGVHHAPTFAAIRTALSQAYPGGSQLVTIAHWNDHPARTWQDVRTVLNRAIHNQHHMLHGGRHDGH